MNLPPLPDEYHTMSNMITSMIDHIEEHDLLDCDEACQQDRKNRELYNQYLKAEETKEHAPEEYEKARRAFYVHQHGKEQYKKMRQHELTEQSNQVIQDIQDTFHTRFYEVKQQDSSVKKLKSSVSHLDELIEKYKKENEAYKKNIDTLQRKNQTNERKSYYEEQRIEGYLFLYNLLIRMLWFFVLVYIVLIILGEQYKNRFYQLSALLLIVISTLPWKKLMFNVQK